MFKMLEPCIYKGDNLLFLQQVVDLLKSHEIKDDVLFRATEEEHVWKVVKYGTDRVGFPGKKIWPHSGKDQIIYHEDVIIAATRGALVDNEADPQWPTLFTNFTIYPKPVLIIYDKSYFLHLRENHYKFINDIDRIKTVLALIPVTIENKRMD